MKEKIDCKEKLTKGQGAAAVLFVFAAWFFRSYGGFQRFPAGGDEFYIVNHCMILKKMLLSGDIGSFAEGLMDFFARPSGHLFNLVGALLGNKAGIYFIYSVYGVVSLLILFFLTRRIFGNQAALGTLFLGAMSAVHINYSMKARCIILSFMLASASLYFFMESLYGNNKTRDKIISGVFMGIAFTSHTSAGVFPFVYVATEIYVFIREKDKRKGFIKRFFLLLISMALPIILWETLSYSIIHFGTITSPYFNHYLKRLMFHENFKIPMPPRLYFTHILFGLESAMFFVPVFAGILSIVNKKIEQRQKTLFVMAAFLLGLFLLMPHAAGMSRLVFSLYIFMLPIGGLGMHTIYNWFKNKNFAHFAVLLVAVFIFKQALLAARTISYQQNIPDTIFNFLKKENIKKVILGKGGINVLPYLKPKDIWKKEVKISDASGYQVTLYFTHNPRNVAAIAKKHNVKYLLAHYLDYQLDPNGHRHFMFYLHKAGVKKPVISWGNDQRFPISYFDEESFKVEAYERLYAERAIPVSSENLIYHGMLYDLSPVLEKGIYD